jgi:hypothetical protein
MINMSAKSRGEAEQLRNAIQEVIYILEDMDDETYALIDDMNNGFSRFDDISDWYQYISRAIGY